MFFIPHHLSRPKYKRHILILLLCISIPLIPSHADPQKNPQVIRLNLLKKVLFPGSTIMVRIEGITQTTNTSIVLQQKKKLITRSSTIVANNTFGKNNNKDNYFIAILGTPSTLTPGMYTLALEKKSSKTLYSPIRINIYPKKFKEDIVVIPKTKEIDKGNVKEQKKIRKQAKNMWDLTKQIFEDNTYQLTDFEIPVKDYKYISGNYGDRRIYKNTQNKKTGQSVHGGVDFAAKKETPIYAPAKAKVVFVSYRIVTGYTIVLSHYPGIFSLYYHMAKVNVKENDIVYPNEKIGEIGNTGFSTGSHLHWEMRVNNTQVNPLEFIKK